MRGLKRVEAAAAAAGGHMDLKWWRSLRVREEAVEEGE